MPTTSRGRWWASFAGFLVLIICWSLASPVYSGPDEPDHVLRAASVVRGQWLGPATGEAPDYDRLVDVPEAFLERMDVTCFKRHPEAVPACAVAAVPDYPPRITTSAGRHPPAYYVVVGVPSLAVGACPFGAWSCFDMNVNYPMRFLSAILTGTLFASAFASIRQSRQPAVVTGVALFALTPMVLFVSGIVNPSAIEIAAAMLLWSSAFVLVQRVEDGTGVERRLVDRSGVAALALVLSRALSPLWLLLIGVGWLAFARRETLRTILTDARSRVWAGVVTAVTLAQTAWVVLIKPLDSINPVLNDPPPQLVLIDALRFVMARQFNMYRELIGNFGWIDTPIPMFGLILWTAAIGLVLVVALVVASRRQLRTLVGLVVAVVMAPVVIELSQLSTSGDVWQGRYTLPLAVGIPVLAGLAIGARASGDSVASYGRRAVMVMAPFFVLAHVVAFDFQLRRNTVGVLGRLDYWLEPDWSPPWVPVPLLLVIFLGAVVAVPALLILLAHAEGETATSSHSG